jgi:hypothetical protein
MKGELEINLPNDYSAITLDKWLRMRKDLQSYSDNEEASLAVMFYHLCDIKPEWLKTINVESFNYIKDKLNRFINDIELPLQKFIYIDGVEYGFEPDLSNIAYGAYIDISNYDTIEINEKWAEIMSILYRPVERKVGHLYSIKPYTGVINGEPFKQVHMDIHFGTLFFLKTLLQDLLQGIQSYLMASVEIPPNIKLILETNGALTLPLSNWQEVISYELTKLSNNR